MLQNGENRANPFKEYLRFIKKHASLYFLSPPAKNMSVSMIILE